MERHTAHIRAHAGDSGVGIASGITSAYTVSAAIKSNRSHEPCTWAATQ